MIANKTEEEYNHEWKAIPFGHAFKEAPLTFVTILSHNGGNTAGIRMTNLNESSVEVFIEEETSGDSETNHVKETLGWLVLEAPNTLAV
jgi:serine protease AprX